MTGHLPFFPQSTTAPQPMSRRGAQPARMDAPTFGLPSQAIAILMIVFGFLILFVPPLLPWLVGILLIVVGIAWLAGSGGWAGPRREVVTRRERYPRL